MDDQLVKLKSFLENYDILPYTLEISAIFIFLFFLVLRKLSAKIVIGLVKKLTNNDPNTWVFRVISDLENPIKLLFVVIGFSVSTTLLDLPSNWDDFIGSLKSSLYTYCLFWAMFNAISTIGEGAFMVGERMGKAVNQDLKGFFLRSLEVIIVMIGAVAILEQWDINVSAFLGGIGLAGMAIALAAKDTVANIFGTMTIFIDKVFQKGDWIQTPSVEGIVEHIGLRACKIRTFSKALVNVPNAELSNSPITNWSRMTNRRITMNLSLEYRTTAQQLEAIVQNLRDFLANDPEVAIEGDVIQMVHLTEFAASSIDINLYYFTKTRDWGEFRQVKNDHIIAFKKIVEEAGSGFAFPSRSVYVEGDNSSLQTKPQVLD